MRIAGGRGPAPPGMVAPMATPPHPPITPRPPTTPAPAPLEARPLVPLLCPPLFARRSWCRLVAGLATRRAAGSGARLLGEAPTVLCRPLTDPELLLCAPSGSWGITAQGALTGSRRPHPAVSAHAAHLLHRTAIALTLLSGHAVRHLRAAADAPSPAQCIWRLGGCLVAWDEVLPGWGRWGAAAVALELALHAPTPALRRSLLAQAGRDAGTAGSLLALAPPGGIEGEVPTAPEAARRCHEAWNAVLAWLGRLREAWAAALTAGSAPTDARGPAVPRPPAPS